MSQDYESSVSQRFALVVEQLEQCAGLIEDGSIPKLRMAIVLMDNLADTFLYRVCLDHIARANQQTFGIVKKQRLSKGQAIELERSFVKKLKFVADNDPQKRDGYRLTSADIDLLSVGHAYRNAIYHRDSHNPSVIPVLARLLFAATNRLFRVSTRASDGGTRSEATQRDLEPFSRYDVIDSAGFFWPHKAADNVARRLQKRIIQDSGDAVSKLAADLQSRCNRLTRLMRSLPSVEAVLPWAEFWDLHGFDRPLVQLADRADLWLRREEFAVDKESVWIDVNQAEEQLNVAVKQLWSNFSPQVSLDEIHRATQIAENLTTLSRDIATALHAYHEVDQRLNRLERYLWEIEEDYDREASREADRRREPDYDDGDP